MSTFILETSDDVKINVSRQVVDSSGLLSGLINSIGYDGSPIPVNVTARFLRLALVILEDSEVRTPDDDRLWMVSQLSCLDDAELASFAWQIDFIDSDRIISAIVKSIMDRGTNDVERLRTLLGIQNDYSKEEMVEIETNPLSFFCGKNVQFSEEARDS